MYKVGDNVLYKNDGDCVIQQKHGVIGVVVNISELDPYFKPGDRISLDGELKGKLLKQQFSKVDTNNMEVLAVRDNDVLIKGVGVYYPSFMFKYAPKPRYEVRYTVYDNLSGMELETFSSEKEGIEKCETLNKVSINIGDIFKHSDGTTVEVVNSTLEETEVMLEVAGSVYYSKYNTQQFLKEFTKQ